MSGSALMAAAAVVVFSLHAQQNDFVGYYGDFWKGFVLSMKGLGRHDSVIMMGTIIRHLMR